MSLSPIDHPSPTLGAIVRSSHDAIISKTLDGVITTWNDAAERLYGYRADEVVGRHAELLYPPARRSEETAILEQLARGDRVDQYMTDRVRRDGTTVTVALSASLMNLYLGVTSTPGSGSTFTVTPQPPRA
jgi:PAS domain S-box-containing protein